MTGCRWTAQVTVFALLFILPALATFPLVPWTREDIKKSNFGLAFKSITTYRIAEKGALKGDKAPKGDKASPITKICFQLSAQALRWRGVPGQVSPCSASNSTCCRPYSTGIKTVTLSPRAACTDGLTQEALRQPDAARWTLNGSRLALDFEAAAGVKSFKFEVTSSMRSAWTGASPTQLCFEVPGASSTACGTPESLCGLAGCAIRVETPIFERLAPPGQKAKGKARCALAGVVPTGCPLGSGTLDGYSCELCPKGWYQNETFLSAGLPECKECPALTTTQGPGGVTCDLCINGYGGNDDGVCSMCLPGTFGHALLTTEPCQPCGGINEYSSVPGSTTCSKCPINQVANEDHTGCVCAKGFGGNPSGDCLVCPAGYAGNLLPPNKACWRCGGLGEYSAAGSAACSQCPANQTANSQHSGCVCADGFGGHGSGNCTQCPAGTAATGFSPTEPCQPCNGTDEYSAAAGSLHCSTCPPNQVGNADHTGCVCAVGFGGSAEGVCAKCPAGTSAQSLSPFEPCQPCGGINEYSSMPESATCGTCPPSQVANVDHTGCVCADGFGGGSRGECSPCPAGWYGDVLNATQPCRPCSGADEYTAVQGSETCSKCPVNQVANADHAGCVCADGFGIGADGECTQCPAGWSGLGLNTSEPCKPCSASNEYSSAAGSATCSTCPANHVANKDHTACVCSDGFGGGTDGVCTRCSAGWSGLGLIPSEPCKPCSGLNEYSSANGSTSCSTCPTNQVANTDHTGCVCADGFGGDADGVCTQCPAGWAGSGLGVGLSCIACSGSAEYSGEIGSSSCSVCPPNQVANSNHTGCVCIDGFGGSPDGSCKPCPAGTAGHSLTTGESCQACSGRTEYSSQLGSAACGTCPSNQVANIDHSACVCTDGFGGGADGVCTQCPAGSAGTALGPNKPCDNCSAANEYSVAAGAGRCSTCPSNQVANSDHTGCVCADGYGGNPLGDCSLCPEGFAGLQHNTTNPCTPCNGTYQYSSATGSTSCQICPVNQVANSDHTDCVCTPGYGGSAAGVCYQCPAGWAGLGLTLYQACWYCGGLFQYSGTPGGTSCSTCPANHIANKDHTGCYDCSSFAHLGQHMMVKLCLLQYVLQG